VWNRRQRAGHRRLGPARARRLLGALEPAWLVGWALLVASVLPLRWLENWLQSLFGLRFGVLLRRRLMAGATRLDPESVRGEGAGALLGRVLDSEALEALLLAGGFVLVGAAIDVTIATWVLAHGPRRCSRSRCSRCGSSWRWRSGSSTGGAPSRRPRSRLDLTHDLVERMQGQRTRVVQEPRERWHLEEDALLARYLAGSRRLDRAALALLALVSGGWLVAGAVALGSALATGSASSLQLAVGLGAILLGQQALARLGSGLVQLSTCAVAWRNVRPIFSAAARVEDAGLPRAALRPESTRRAARRCSRPASSRSGIAAREREALRGASFELGADEKVLLEGPSGSGKSTLVSLLAGWRTPRSGALLLDGLDRASQVPRAGARASPPRRSSTRTTCSPGRWPSTCLLSAPPEPELPAGAMAQRRPRNASRHARTRCASSSASVPCSSACPRACARSSARRAGSSPTARGAVCSWRARCSPTRASWCWTRASRPSIPRPRPRCWPACAGARPALLVVAHP
jgi:hypothetical protein